MRFLFPFMLQWLVAVSAYAQLFEGTVLDATTREPLPFASIYINKVSKTITNIEGGFSVKCDSSSILRISYVGYKTLQLPASQLSPVILMQPMERQVGEVVVLPIHLRKFIQKTTKETLRQLQKNRRQEARFFYRQTAFSRNLRDSLSNDSTCNELLEAFITGKSAVSLRDLQLLTGRYAAVVPDSTMANVYYRNFYTYSQIDFAAKSTSQSWRDVIPPLFPYWSTYYDVDYDVAFDESGSRLIVLHFVPKPDIRRSILAATIYVDEQTFHVRRIVGYGINNLVAVDIEYIDENQKSRLHRWVLPSFFSFDVNMTEEREFVEVQSAYIREYHYFNGYRIFTTSTLYNVGPAEHEHGASLEFFGHLHDTIDNMEYDPVFWRNNEIVRRTPVEQDVLQLFEDKELFGVWK